MNAVVTIAVGSKYKKMAELTHPTIKSYADKIGAEFIVINESNCSTPHWEKFQIYSLLNKYDRILYIDTDIIVRDDCPNLFDIVPMDKLGIFNETPYTDGRGAHFLKTCEDYGIRLNSWNSRYYNTGVMVISKIHKYVFKKPGKEISNYYEQSYLNAIIAATSTSVYELDFNFNRMTCLDRFTGLDRHASYIIHYAGYPNFNLVLNLIENDLAVWKKDIGNYNYKRHILVDVQGGLGDQICAEPAIRFMINNIYKNQDIVVKTHFPRIFSHLGIPIFEHKDFVPAFDTPYFHVISLPGPETITWKIVSNLLCHTVDYAAMALLARILPNKDKQFHLDVNEEDIAEVKEVVCDVDYSKLVLIHPGRHWESKTLPIEWWQEVVDGIAKHKQVCLIGKEEYNRGTQPINVKDGIIDSRNLLSLGALFALISMSNTVLSNDSAPIHIAGAFDTNIVLIPTCKHPDHLLPWRNGTQNYKACALYKNLVVDDCRSDPTCIHGSSAEFIHNTWDYYLPSTKEVIEKVLKISRK